MASVPSHITLIGAGKVGSALNVALHAAGLRHRLWAYRRPLPKRLDKTDLIVICVRDAHIKLVVDALSKVRLNPHCVVVHVSGVEGPDVLGALKSLCSGVGQWHPFLSIRSKAPAPVFAGAHFLGSGDAAAQRATKWVTRQLGGVYHAGEGVDRVKYHFAAALLANGSLALLSEAQRMLSGAGIDGPTATAMLLSLGQSVYDNARQLGIDAALTGPVRRGDVGTLRRHLEQLEPGDATARTLYRCLGHAQLTMVARLGELTPAEIRRMRRQLSGPT